MGDRNAILMAQQKHRVVGTPPIMDTWIGRVRAVVLFVILSALAKAASGQEVPQPIIDVHLHARDGVRQPRPLCIPVTVYGVSEARCEDPFLAPLTDTAMVVETVDVLNRRNVYGIISGYPLARVQRFQRAAPHRLTPAYQFSPARDPHLSVEELRAHLERGDFQVLGEVDIQYDGIRPDDPRMESYWALAEELDVPVALHLGEGYPGVPYEEVNYRVELGRPVHLEEVLVKHPNLRIYVMHYGSPLVEEMIGVMYAYPNVYVDVGGNLWPYPRSYVYSQLRQFVDAGFGKRILFGSDQMSWPGLIEESIAVIVDAPFLTDEQKRDILYNNAARFFRLTSEEVERHHRGGSDS